MKQDAYMYTLNTTHRDMTDLDRLTDLLTTNMS